MIIGNKKVVIVVNNVLSLLSDKIYLLETISLAAVAVQTSVPRRSARR